MLSLKGRRSDIPDQQEGSGWREQSNKQQSPHGLAAKRGRTLGRSQTEEIIPIPQEVDGRQDIRSMYLQHETMRDKLSCLSFFLYAPPLLDLTVWQEHKQ
eukprot:768795-Hanusia_phi.AAC.9